MVNQTFTNAVLQGREYRFFSPNGAGITYPAGTVLNAKINTAQTGATVLTYTVDLFGYLN